jgi:putative selenate reductase
MSRSGRLVGVDCVRNRLGEPGPDGRRRPIPVPETRFRIPAETLILAVGQTQASGSAGALLVTRGSDDQIVTDPLTGATTIPHVYAGGDVVRGPSTIIEAVADGRRAAEAICSHLGVRFSMPAVPGVLRPAERVASARVARARRLEPCAPRRLSIPERGGFALVTATLDDDAASAEAARCLQCQLACDKCVDVCPNRANQSYTVDPIEVRVPTVDLASGAAVEEDVVRLSQSRQIVHIVDLCNECGNCATFCVHDGRPFADKPRLFLSRALFDAAEGSALCFSEDVLLGRDADSTSWKLEPTDEGFRYTDAGLVVRLRPTLEVAEARLAVRGVGVRSTARAVRAAALFCGLHRSPVRELTRDMRGGA